MKILPLCIDLNKVNNIHETNNDNYKPDHLLSMINIVATTLQFGSVAIISEAYRRLFNFGAETLQRDFDLEHAFD